MEADDLYPNRLEAAKDVIDSFIARRRHDRVGMVAFGAGAGLGWPYYAGVAVGAAIIAYEHQLVRPGDLSRLDAAFFTSNGVVSIVVFLGAFVDRVL